MRKTISTVAIALAVLGGGSVAMAGTALASPAGAGVKTGCGWSLVNSPPVYSCTNTTNTTNTTSGTGGGTASNTCVNTAVGVIGNGTSGSCSSTSTGGTSANYCINNGTNCTTSAGPGQVAICHSLSGCTITKP